MSIIVTGMDIPKSCSDCPICIFSADEKRHIGYCNTSNDDYYCKVLNRFMEYDEVDGGVDILGKPKDCPLKSVEGLIEKIVNTPSSIDSDKYKTKYDGSAMRQNEIIDIIKEYCEVSE